MRVELLRTYQEKQTLGTWLVFNEMDQVIFKCVTIELPWKDNKNDISCIPEATYKLIKLAHSDSFAYAHFEICNVPDRGGIKVHVANYVRQLKGCVAVGSDYLDLDNDGWLDVRGSAVTLKKLIKLLPNECEITIKKAA